MGAIFILYGQELNGVSLQQKLGTIFILVYFILCLSVALCCLQEAAAELDQPLGLYLTIFILLGGLCGEVPAYLAKPKIILKKNGSWDYKNEIVPRLSDSPHLALKHWLALKVKINEAAAYPIYVVSAQGGGLYAAYHTAITLARLEDHCATFYDHLFVISGVSGGSIGALVFKAVVESVRHRSLAFPVGPTAKCGDIPDKTPYEDIIDEVFSADLLSPVLTRAFFYDLPFHFIHDQLAYMWKDYYPNRGDSLGSALHSAIQKALSDHGVYSNVDDIFAKAATTQDPSSPALLFNSTVLDTGEPLLIGPFDVPYAHLNSGARQLTGSRSVGYVIPGETFSTIDAAVHSSRYPIVTPPAAVQDQDGHVVRIGDGGYFENSGANGLLVLMSDLLHAPNQTLALGNANETDPTGLMNIKAISFTHSINWGYSSQIFADFLGPVVGLLNSRGTRGFQYVDDLENLLGDKNVARVPLAEQSWQPKLGWVLTKQTLSEIKKRSWNSDLESKILVPLVVYDKARK